MLMKRIYKRLENYWGVGERPILVLLYTVITVSMSMMLAFFMVVGVRVVLGAQSDSKVEGVLKGDSAPVVLIQDVEDNIHALNVRDNTLKETGLKGQSIIYSDDYTSRYVVDVTANSLELAELKINEDNRLKITDKTIQVKLDSRDSVEMKISQGHLFILNQTTNELIQASLATGEELNCWGLETPVVDWELSEGILYLLHEDKLMAYDVLSHEKKLELNAERVGEIGVNGSVVTLVELDDSVAFVGQYEAKTSGLLNSLFYQVEDLRIVSSEASEPYIYLYIQNDTGGLCLEIKDIETEESYVADFNFNNVKEGLLFSKGHGYYVNNSGDIVIASLDGDEKTYNFEGEIKSFAPLY